MTATIPELLTQRASAGSAIVLRKKDRGLWKTVTWADLDARRGAVAAALQGMGFRQGDVAGILSETTPDAVYVDLGILTAGGVSLAIHPEEEADQVRAILRDSGCRVLFAENEEQLDKALTIREFCPALTRIVILDMKGLREFSDSGCQSFESFVGPGGSAQPVAIRPDHPAVLLVPRGGGAGRTLTHAEVLAKVAEAGKKLGVRAGDERLAVLPMSDSLERIHGIYLALEAGIVSNYLESPETARENLQQLKPTLFGADAEAWTRLHARISGAAAAATGLQRVLYNWAIGAGSGNFLANALVLSAVRRELGMDRLRVAYVAGNKPSAEVSNWASALGVSIQLVET
jgi:long-chain acyl-CoA synthetase